MIPENLANHSPTEYQPGEIVLLKADPVSKRGKLIIMNINNRIERRNSRFYNLLTAPRTVSRTRALAARAQSSANHVQPIECISRATCVPCYTKVCLLVGCLTSQQHASVSQGRICSDNFTCCHTEIEVAHQTFHLTQPQYSDTGPTSPSADPVTPGAWQGSHWSVNV